MFWVMSPVCWAFATAVELSLSTLSATAALIGAAMFALISDIAARSGSGSPASLSSSSRVSALYSCSLPMGSSLWLRDRVGRHQAVELVGGNGGIGGNHPDPRHHLAVGEVLALLFLEFLLGQISVGPGLSFLVAHSDPLLFSAYAQTRPRSRRSRRGRALLCQRLRFCAGYGAL